MGYLKTGVGGGSSEPLNALWIRHWFGEVGPNSSLYFLSRTQVAKIKN